MPALARPRTPNETDSTAVPTPPATREPQPLRPPTLQMTMYFSPEGVLHHTRCRSALHFRGVRAEVESDFWCASCHEHVAVPRFAVSQIPVETVESERATGTNPLVRLVRTEVENRRSAS